MAPKIRYVPNRTIETDIWEIDFEALRRNDPSVSHIVCWRDYKPGYGVELGQALVGNTHVSHLTLSLHNIVTARERRADSLTDIVSYVRAGPALRVLELCGRMNRPEHRALRDTLFHAAASNHNLVELTIRFVIEDVNAFCQLVQQTKSIRRLTCKALFRSDDPLLQQMSLALGSNDTLHFLQIDMIHSSASAYPILLALSTHSCLTELRFEYSVDEVSDFTVPVSVREALQSLTSQLSVLQLAGCTFDRQTMEDLILGLTSDTRLETLVLYQCHLDATAAQRFLDFGQSHVSGSKLCEIGFKNAFSLFHSRASVESKAIGTLIPRFLSKNESSVTSRSNIGCQISKIILDLEYYKYFFVAYAAQARTIRLPHLELRRVDAECWGLLARRLRSIVHLKELTLKLDHDAVPAVSLLKALRHNGILVEIHISPKRVSPKGASHLTELETRRVDAYLARNSYVSTWWTQSAEGRAPTNDEHETNQLLFPLVAQSVRPVDAMAAHMVFAGLLSVCDDSIGPDHGATSISGNVRVLPSA